MADTIDRITRDLKTRDKSVRAVYVPPSNLQAQNQMDSVDNHFMRNSDPRMPLFADRKSTTSRGSGFGSGSK
jgi:hypothetical protein